MSQRKSGHERMKRDLYETPDWCTRALVPHIPDRIRTVFEPCAGTGKIASVLIERRTVYQNDIYPTANLDGFGDFLTMPIVPADAVITNPPYKLAAEFVRHSVNHYNFVAMLLRCDWHHAKTRAELFDRPSFAKIVALRKRVIWFEAEAGTEQKQPSFNHSWFIWDKFHAGPPILEFAPKEHSHECNRSRQLESA